MLGFHIICVNLPSKFDCQDLRTISHKLIMQIKKVILSIILGVATTTSCFAQESTGNEPHAFVQAQGGLNTILCPGRKIAPTFSIAGGYMFTPTIGLRLHINGFKVKNGFHSVSDMYKYKYLNTNFDLMVNLTNFGKKPADFFNVYLVAGAGLAYCWDNEEFASIAKRGVITEDISNAWINDTHKDLLTHNIRAGLLFDFNITKDFSAGVEIDLNNLSDRFDSRYNDGCDWMATGQISVTYKFGYKK